MERIFCNLSLKLAICATSLLICIPIVSATGSDQLLKAPNAPIIPPAREKRIRTSILNMPDVLNEVLYLCIEFEKNNRFVIKVSLCNAGKVKIRMLKLMLLQAYFLEVSIHDSKGQEIKFIGADYSSEYPEEIILKQHCCLTKLIDLLPLFYFTEIGEYVIFAQYFSNIAGPNESDICIRSNSLKLHLDESDEKYLYLKKPISDPENLQRHPNGMQRFSEKVECRNQ
jgi:hypothetical protein